MRLAADNSGAMECSGCESTAAVAADDICGGAVVVVGVKVDSRSRELLTWALVKVAQSGDRIIALHVLDPDAGENIFTVPPTRKCVCSDDFFTS